MDDVYCLKVFYNCAPKTRVHPQVNSLNFIVYITGTVQYSSFVKKTHIEIESFKVIYIRKHLIQRTSHKNFHMESNIVKKLNLDF